MKSKLTKEYADCIVVYAQLVVKQNPCMRLGQVIMNNLNVEVAENLSWYATPQTDFYYWTDEDKVLEVFYRECVED